MTTQQPEALRLAVSSSAMADEGEMIHLLSWYEIRNLLRADAAELRRLHTENTALQQGYAAARLEIESLQARIKTMAEEHADELMVAHMDGRMRAAQPAGEYPALPDAAGVVVEHVPVGGGWVRHYQGDSYTADQMRTYADATCAMRAAQPASGLDPELGPMLDFANAGEIAFYDYAVAQHCRATLDILDGKDNGAGACNEPWASVRKRLLSIVELHQSSSAAQGQAPAQAAPVCGSPADLPPLPDPDLRDVGTTPGGIKEFLRGYATEYAKAALAACPPADSVTAPAAGAVAGPTSDLHPEKCPITGRPFFMTLDHPELGRVPTYGGPYDSYTIPAPEGEPTDPWHERELRSERYDHDAGWWVEGGEPIPLRIVHEDVLFELQEDAEAAAAPTPPAQAADSVLEDAARLDWLLLHISGAEFRRIGVHYSGNASRADVDAARKQGANHD